MSIERIECVSSVDHQEWDALAARFSGSYFHCSAYAMHGSSRSDVEPLFVKAFDRNGECEGIAVGTIQTPRLWPFSRYCREAVFGALPATGGSCADTQREIMRAAAQELSRRGVFMVHISSYESPDSGEVLSELSYEMHARAEFYIDLSKPLDEIWKSLHSGRRTDIRKARKLGVETRLESTIEGLRLLHRFQRESLERHGIEFRRAEDRAERTKATLLDTGRAIVLVSYLEGKAINAAMFGVFAGRVYYLHSGSSQLGNRSAGPSHLLWTVIELMKGDGQATLNLGGVSTEDNEKGPQRGLFTFKRDFGAPAVVQPSGRCIISQRGARMNAASSVLKRATGRGSPG